MKNQNDFSTRLNFACVLHTDVNDISRIKEFFEDLENTTLIYQKADNRKLRIVPEDPAEP